MYDIKLTVLINLSLKSYEGGKFCLWRGNETEVKELNTPGNAIMFKSNINHKVYPIIKGERRTLAIFIKGPRFT
jgi:predicted 2-oxoglutarate/Fe(II)-dependent dioxygenase YbiX